MRRTTAVALATVGLAVTVALLAAAPAGSVLAAQDRCLRGEWRMSNSASNAFLQSLVSSGNIRVVEGVITAAFPRRGPALYGSTHFVVQVSGPGLDLKGTATFHFEAPWQTRNRTILLGPGRSELVISKFQATKDGRTITVPGPPPTIRRTPRGGTPYTCNSTTLRWKVPLNDTWTLFRRVG
jgi:hypothetical protein